MRRPLRDLLRFQLVLAVAVAGCALFVRDLWAAARSVDPLPYSEFQRLLRDGQVAEVVVSEGVIEGRLRVPAEGRARFVTAPVAAELAAELERHGVRYTGRSRGAGSSMYGWAAAAVAAVVAAWSLGARRAGRGGSAALQGAGNSRARVYLEQDTKVAFKDVAGVDEAKAELEEIVAFLKDPRGRGRLGARVPKGVLLVGPPGTGKTLLARAVAGEAAVPFFSINGSEFVEMFVGVGAARVRDLFLRGRGRAPCIIFIDELDALGRARGAYAGGGANEEKEQTLNQLLVELDGFDPSSGIVLLAATNRPEILDPALLRAGRFDRQVLVARPDRAGREAILAVHLRRVTAAPDLDVGALAALTPGFTGADLANFVNEAALVATRRDAAHVAMPDFTAALERIVAGLEKRNRLLNPLERAVVAHHEMGHAIVAAALPGCDPVQKVSIVPRGVSALGYTLQRPTEDRYLMTRAELETKLAVLVAGRAAEQVVYAQLSTGAADDLARATDIAVSMITRYALVPELGHLTYELDAPAFAANAPHARRPHSEQTAREIDRAARAILDAAFVRARACLGQNRAVLVEAAALLLERETLGEGELAAIFARVAPERLAPAA
jgi:cell division protease FtsH